MRATLAFGSRKGKRLSYRNTDSTICAALQIVLFILPPGKVEKDYSAAEFERLTEQQRVNLGLRTFILEDLLRLKHCRRPENKWNFITFALHTKMNQKHFTFVNVKSLQIVS